MLRFVSTAIVCLAGASAAHAEALRPMEGRSIALGDAAGVAYYTIAEDGYRIVATMAVGEGTPMRVLATLAAGQRIVLSVPQAAGQPSLEVEIARRGDAVFVSDPAAIAKLN